MDGLAIRTENISKRYRIGARRPNRLLSAAIGESITKPFFGLHEAFTNRREHVWALRDIDIEVPKHEVVGIIGRNGSGKSTLLKIIAGITEPTTGRAEINGRIASLLEVGTGFHPELTGRENIYLNGTILGMKRREIDRKFDEIVEFSEIAKFIDTPVKRYSSGMGVRLAFAVAAHLEPEILVIDEVLAVGDLKFQRKCLDKMNDVVRDGKTILFVSHQMNAIRRLCTQTIWLEKGRIAMSGPTSKVVSAYESACLVESADDLSRGEIHATQFLSWRIQSDTAEDDPHVLDTTGPFQLRLRVRVKDKIDSGLHGIALWNAEDVLIWGYAVQNLTLEPGVHDLVYEFPTLPVRPGIYRFHFSLWDGAKLVDEWYGVPELIVATQPLTHFADEWAGILNVPPTFSLETGNSKLRAKVNVEPVA